MYCDNTCAIAQAKEPRAHQKNKHILRKFHLIQQFVDNREIKISKVHMDTNLVDPLTKPLPQPKFETHVRAMGMRCLRPGDA